MDNGKSPLIMVKNGSKKIRLYLRLKEGIKVTFTKGALGSVYLQKENSNKRIKVKRVK